MCVPQGANKVAFVLLWSPRYYQPGRPSEGFNKLGGSFMAWQN